ncbi:unnamed protein product [Lampetra planeri]
MRRYSHKEKPPAMTFDEETILQQAPCGRDPVNNPPGEEEAAAATMREEARRQQQEPEKGNEIGGWLDRLMVVVSQVTVQLFTPVARGGATESAMEIPAVEAAQPMDDIFWVDQMAPESTTAPVAQESAPDRPRWITPVKEFVAAGGDWGAFTRRFEEAYWAIGLTEEEALRVLPTTLNDDVLAVFQAVPEEQRATHQMTYFNNASE